LIQLKDRIKHSRFQTSGVPYFEYYEELVASINDLYECPISLTEISSLVVLPSGITIDEEAADQLIRAKKADPFNRQNIDNKIVNRFAISVREITDKVEALVAENVHEREQALEAKRRIQETA